MKKNQGRKIQKLRLSRETLRDLKSPEAQKVVGGDSQVDSCPSGWWMCPCRPTGEIGDTQ